MPGWGSATALPRWGWWLFVLALAVFLLTIPLYADLARQLDISVILILALLALSMSFLWGYVGILSFGQTAFYGLGGYTYAVLALNTGDTMVAFFAGLVLPMLFAAIVGYFMIYGRISDIYLSVTTLVITLIPVPMVQSVEHDRVAELQRHDRLVRIRRKARLQRSG